MANPTLGAIRTKVRLLTRSPQPQQLSDAAIDEYVNTFIAYDIPEHLRLFTLRKTLTFYMQPFQDVYKTNTTDPTDPLYQFKDRYITVHAPMYVAGYQCMFTQSREQFYGIYPRIGQVVNQQISNGTNLYAGTLQSFPVLRNSVSFTMVDALGFSSQVHDTGTLNPVTGLGIMVGNGIGSGTIDYETGVYTIIFNAIPAAGTYVVAEYSPYQPARPQAVLFFNNEFTIRPVPDKGYSLSCEVNVRPTQLIAAGSVPDMEQWWAYIAYGAAKKVFEDRMDMDSIQLIMPEFKQQELMVLRRTLVQQSNERTATIFTDAVDFGYRSGFGGGQY